MLIVSRFATKISFLVLLASVLSCQPKTITNTTKPYTPTPDHKGFVVFDLQDTTDLTEAEEIGEVGIKDGGFTLRCDLESVLALAEIEARRMGANAIKIYEHKYPDAWSTCHRIKAKALKIADVTPFEKEIKWHAQRKLKQEDFKASPLNRPFEAATNTSLSYGWYGSPITGKVIFTVKSVFHCYGSYFKNTLNPAQTLAHEQGHFDITEIHARKLTKAIQEQVKSMKDLEQQHEQIFTKIRDEWQKNQDQYDYDIYNDITKQKMWFEQIQTELDSLSTWSSKEVTIPFKTKKSSD